MKQRITVVLAVLGIILGAFAVWRFTAKRPAPSKLDTGPGVKQLYEQEQQEAGRPTPDEVASAALKNSIVDAGHAAQIPNAAGLGEAVRDTIGAYALADVHEFVDWQIAAGIEPVPKWRDDPSRFQSAWDTLRATFVFADIDESRVRVIRRSHDEDRWNGTESQIKSKTRPEGRPFLAGYRGELVICEVLLPGTYPTIGGDFVETELGIEMTLRPDNGEWVITGIYHYADKQPAPQVAIPPL